MQRQVGMFRSGWALEKTYMKPNYVRNYRRDFLTPEMHVICPLEGV